MGSVWSRSFLNCFDLPFHCWPDLIKMLDFRFQVFLVGNSVFLQIGFLFVELAFNSSSPVLRGVLWAPS